MFNIKMHRDAKMRGARDVTLFFASLFPAYPSTRNRYRRLFRASNGALPVLAVSPHDARRSCRRSLLWNRYAGTDG